LSVDVYQVSSSFHFVLALVLFYTDVAVNQRVELGAFLGLLIARWHYGLELELQNSERLGSSDRHTGQNKVAGGLRAGGVAPGDDVNLFLLLKDVYETVFDQGLLSKVDLKWLGGQLDPLVDEFLHLGDTFEIAPVVGLAVEGPLFGKLVLQQLDDIRLEELLLLKMLVLLRDRFDVGFVESSK
jgi:hypothetical protein